MIADMLNEKFLYTVLTDITSSTVYISLTKQIIKIILNHFLHLLHNISKGKKVEDVGNPTHREVDA